MSTARMSFSLGHPDTGTSLRDQHHCSARGPDLQCERHHRDVTDGMPSPRKLPAEVVPQSFQELIKGAQKLENTVEPVVGWGVHSLAIEGVDHDALWQALLNNEVRQPGAHAEFFDW